MLRLDTAVVHREGRVALLEAYKGTEVFGFEFPYELGMGKADADTLNGSSYTALHIAAYNGHLEAAALLIERGAKVNLVSRFGDTPLDWAHAHRAYQNTEEMIALLKSKGAKRKSERKTHSRYSFIRCSWQRCTIFNSLYLSTLLSLLCQARRMQLFSSLSV